MTHRCPGSTSCSPRAAFCPARSVPSSHNPCFFCWPAEGSLPSWKRARSRGPPQLMQYLLLWSRAGSCREWAALCGAAAGGWGFPGVPPTLLLRASGVKPKLPRAQRSSDMSWTRALGRAHESVSVSKGLSTGLRGYLGTRGQSPGVGQPGYQDGCSEPFFLEKW